MVVLAHYASFGYEVPKVVCQGKGVFALDLDIKTLATEVNEQGRFIMWAG